MHRLMRISLPFAFLLATVPFFAQPPAGRGGEKAGGKGGNPVGMIREVKPGFYMVPGAGANSGVRVTSAGVILVDGKLPGEKNYDDLMAQIKSVTDQPVKYLFVTHHHQDHTGNNQRFLDAGVPVIANTGLKKALETYNATPKPAPPSVTFDQDYTVRLGGAEARAYHFAPGHTGGDSVVFFPDLKIVMVSDVVTTGRTGPLIDYAGGGSALGYLRALDSILGLDFDTAVPGNGDPLTRADVQAFRGKWNMFLTRAREAIRSGTPRDQLLMRVQTGDLGWTPRIPQADAFYDELK